MHVDEDVEVNVDVHEDENGDGDGDVFRDSCPLYRNHFLPSQSFCQNLVIASAVIRVYNHRVDEITLPIQNTSCHRKND